MKELFQKVFNKNDNDKQHEFSETQPSSFKAIPYEENKPINKKQYNVPMNTPKYPQLLVSSGYSIGRQRHNNQDSLFTFTSNIASNGQQSPFGLFIIADGMGGHEKGELASQIAIQSVAEYIIKNFYLPALSLNDITSQSFQTVLNSAMDVARYAVTEQVPDGGTTLTALMIFGNQVKIAHIGDSRAYHIQDEKNIQILTRDHSLVKRLEELGQLTPDEAAVHPQRNILYRAIGQGEQADPEFISMDLPEKGFLMLCSDGLWGSISDSQIAQIVTSSTNPHQGCQALVKSANDAGGPDNISVILIQIYS